MDGTDIITAASILLPIALGAAMALYPSFRPLGWIAIAFSLGVFGFCAASYWVHANLTSAEFWRAAWLFKSTVGYATGFAVVALALLLDPFSFRKEGSPQKATHASVRMHFFGDDRAPTEVRRANVDTWYAYFNPSARALVRDEATGREQQIAVLPKTWVIFLMFEKPTTYREIVVGFSSPGLPIHDVRQPTEKSVIVSFRDDIPAGELEISTK